MLNFLALLGVGMSLTERQAVKKVVEAAEGFSHAPACFGAPRKLRTPEPILKD